MLRSQHVPESAPQEPAAPQRLSEPISVLAWFQIVAVVFLVMDTWFEIEIGLGLPQAILRLFGGR